MSPTLAKKGKNSYTNKKDINIKEMKKWKETCLLKTKDSWWKIEEEKMAAIWGYHIWLDFFCVVVSTERNALKTQTMTEKNLENREPFFIKKN